MKTSKEEKAMWLEDWRGSGKRAWAYAKENGLIPQTFCSWVKRESQEASGFVEIPRQVKPGKDESRKILIEKGDIKIHIPVYVLAEESFVIMEVLKAVL